MEETSLLMPRVKAGPGKESPGHKLGSLLAVGAQGWRLGQRGGWIETWSSHLTQDSKPAAICGLSCLIPNPTQEIIQDATKKES